MVPTKQTNPLACNVMIVNKDGDLELYQVHDTPKQAVWSARGDLTIGAGKGLKVFEGFPNHEGLDGLHPESVRQTSVKRYPINEKDQASRSRSAPGRADSQRGRAPKLPASAAPPPPSALFAREDEAHAAFSGVSAQLALSARKQRDRDYSPSPFRKYNVGEHGSGVRGANASRSRERKRSPSTGRRKSSKGPDVKSKGVTAVLEDDISMIMYKRALQGYSLMKASACKFVHAH